MNRWRSAGTSTDHNLRVRTSILNVFIVNGSVLPDKHHQCGFTHTAKQREVVLHKASMWHIYSAKDANLILTPTLTPYYSSGDFPQDSLRLITDDVATH